MRILLFTGKGGVGKTTVAAATALNCAQRGYRTMVYSTDAAHSLSDSFDIPIESKMTQIAKNLYAQEIDVNEEIKKNWGPIEAFIQEFLKYRGLDNIIADELAIFPGMEEVFSLLELKQRYVEGFFDVIIIDCAPTGDTLRLLAGPDIAKWYMEKIFNIERTVFKAVRPVAKKFVDMPLPTDAVFDSLEGLYKNLVGIKEVLTDRQISSIRIVLNPEKMVLNESQRAYTFLNLFGYPIDAVIANRILPAEIHDPYYKQWKKIQKSYLQEIKSSFAPLPLFTAKLWPREMVGLDLLEKMTRELYGDKDPAKIFYEDIPLEIKKKSGKYFLFIKLPFATKEDVNVWIKGDELTVRFKNFKRTILLPRVLATKTLDNALMEANHLKITFVDLKKIKRNN